MGESELVEKVRKAIDACFFPATDPGGKPRGAFVNADKDAVARAAIKAVLEEGRHRAVDRRERAFVDAIARANGIDLEQS